MKVLWAVPVIVALAAVWPGWRIWRRRRAARLAEAAEHARTVSLMSQLQEELRAQTEALQAARSELDAFMYGVAHDLRAPLRAIEGFARILEEDNGPQLTGEGSRNLRIIRDNAAKLDRMIEGLLALSRISRHPLNVSEIDMKALVELAARDVMRANSHHNVSLVVEDLPKAWGDSALLLQAWKHLLDNALRFTSRTPAACIRVTGLTEGNAVMFSIEDNGAGFDMRHASKLFGVFQRLHAERDFPGVGVGLAIVHRIVSRHGGRIWAHAQVNKGARFSFSLPLEPVRNAAER